MVSRADQKIPCVGDGGPENLFLVIKFDVFHRQSDGPPLGYNSFSRGSVLPGGYSDIFIHT